MTDSKKIFTVQWHLTNRCDFNCKHCYISKAERKQSNELKTQQVFSVIDEIVDFAMIAEVKIRFCFTGGNPLLRDDISDILAYAGKKDTLLHILGNTSITDKEIEMLKKNNVSRFQLSFDGLKENHDYLRGEGAYDLGMHAIDKLKNGGIDVVVMSTVTKQNQYDIPLLAGMVLSKGVKRFDFARLVPIGNGKELKDLVFTSQEYKHFLNKMYDTYNDLINKGISERALGVKDPLWNLLLYEKGDLKLPIDTSLIYTGCSIGQTGFCIEPDGTVNGCRRMPIGIGNILDMGIRNFFFNNPEINKYREVDNIEKCGDCELLSLCRGCRAVAWAETGSYFGRDPQCWK